MQRDNPIAPYTRQVTLDPEQVLEMRGLSFEVPVLALPRTLMVPQSEALSMSGRRQQISRLEETSSSPNPYEGIRNQGYKCRLELPTSDSFPRMQQRNTRVAISCVLVVPELELPLRIPLTSFGSHNFIGYDRSPV
jgi:hypothetical protein